MPPNSPPFQLPKIKQYDRFTFWGSFYMMTEMASLNSKEISAAVFTHALGPPISSPVSTVGLFPA
jgi:hypothetical protein